MKRLAAFFLIPAAILLVASFGPAEARVGYPSVCKIRAQVVSVQGYGYPKKSDEQGDNTDKSPFGDQFAKYGWTIKAKILQVKYAPIKGTVSQRSDCDVFPIGKEVALGLEDWDGTMSQPVSAGQLFDARVTQAHEVSDLQRAWAADTFISLWWIVGPVLFILAIFAVFFVHRRRRNRTGRGNPRVG